MRDYGIDLMDQLDHISWRRFLVLFQNLNPYGAVATRVQEMTDPKNKELEPEDDEKQAAAFFSQITTI